MNKRQIIIHGGIVTVPDNFNNVCNVCNVEPILSQGACCDCCRLCTQCGNEPRHPNNMLCDDCMAATIKPVSNIPVKHEYEPSWYGAYANVNGNQQINLMSSRQAKMLHLRHACHADCGYCYHEAMEWLKRQAKSQGLCIYCQATDLADTEIDLQAQADYHGEASLTEYEQHFLENVPNGTLCPACIEAIDHEATGCGM